MRMRNKTISFLNLPRGIYRMVKCPKCGYEFENKLKCYRCDHVWYPTGPNLPKVCPNPKCKSPYWNRPRTRKVNLEVRK